MEKVFDLEMKFEGTCLLIEGKIDPNKDGQPIASLALKVELAEIPDEVLGLIGKKKAPVLEAPAV